MKTRRLKRGLSSKELLAGEKGTIFKKWTGRTPVSVVFPNRYYVGMSNLAIQMLYKTMNEIPGVVCERTFLSDGGEVLSLESGRPLPAFQCLFFSLSFELDYLNILTMLRASSIPILAAERGEGDPLVIAGGVCVMSNPEPIAPFFDLFLLGDIEAAIPDFMARYLAICGSGRDGIIEELGDFPWVYRPVDMTVEYGEDGTVRRRLPENFTITPVRHAGKRLGVSVITSENTEFSNIYLTEGTRGCPSRCPFCLIGNIYPFTADPHIPLEAGGEDIGIIGGGVSFHPEITEIITELKDRGRSVHFPSLRIDETPLPVIELVQEGIKTLTFGIEAGSERLRGAMGKPLSETMLLEKIDAILSIKPFNLKLYFMIGLYTESAQDIEAIVELVKRIKHTMVKRGAQRGFVGSITVHCSPFVPKPSTPFQWLPMEETAVLKNRLTTLRRAISRIDNTFFTHESVKYSYLQAVLSRGDRRVSDIIIRLAGGETLARVLRESPLNPNFYALRKRGANEVFPWDFIAGETSKERLLTRLAATFPDWGS